jgi:hypothetical protein
LLVNMVHADVVYDVKALDFKTVAGYQAYKITVTNRESYRIVYTVRASTATGAVNWKDWPLDPGASGYKLVDGDPSNVSVTWKSYAAWVRE